MNDFFDFDGKDLNNVKEGEEFFISLVEKALTSKNSDFRFIRSWEDRIAVRAYGLGVDAVIKIFENLYEATYKVYIKQVTTGEQDLRTILALKQFKQCVEYYQKERILVKDILNEHAEYVWSGHIIDTLVGNYRPDEDLWDHRGRGEIGK